MKKMVIVKNAGIILVMVAADTEVVAEVVAKAKVVAKVAAGVVAGVIAGVVAGVGVDVAIGIAIGIAIGMATGKLKLDSKVHGLETLITNKQSILRISCIISFKAYIHIHISQFTICNVHLDKEKLVVALTEACMQ